MEPEFAIKVENISKTFSIPHEKIDSLRGALANVFKKKTYEEFKALNDVSFEVKKGEFFGIIGRNGSGKSTLLKILAGIYQADRGKIKINGRVSPFLELGIGFNPELSGRDNIYLNGSVLGLSKKQIEEKFNSIVAFSELERFIDQKLKNYSSGMQVRLAFSVSIHANREILLMDEVLAVGDTSFQSKCISEFLKYKKLGKTVVLVTHDIFTTQKYCDRVMLLRNGKISMIGSPQKVGEEYVFQNMTDEEKRIVLEEKRKKIKPEEERKKIKPEEKRTNNINGFPVIENMSAIKKTEIFDAKNFRKNVFIKWDIIKISSTVDFFQKVNNPNFGIIIRNYEGRPVFVANTDANGIKTGMFDIGETVVDFIIKNQLTPGRYTVTSALADSPSARIYDWRDDITEFVIVGGNNLGGFIDLDHEIIINRKNDA